MARSAYRVVPFRLSGRLHGALFLFRRFAARKCGLFRRAPRRQVVGQRLPGRPRFMLNADAVCEELARVTRLAWEVSPSWRHADAASVVLFMRSAGENRALVAVEGANCVVLMWMRRGTAFVELRPGWSRGEDAWRAVTRSLGQLHVFLRVPMEHYRAHPTRDAIPLDVVRKGGAAVGSYLAGRRSFPAFP